MIIKGTRVRVVDNTGARKALCIHVFKRNVAKVGDIIVVTLRRVRPHCKVKRKEIYKALVVRSSDCFSRFDGSVIKFSENCVILLNKKGTPVGNKIKGPIIFELRKSHYTKLLSISSHVI